MNDTPLSVRFAEKAADLAALEAAVLTVAESVGQGLAPDTWRYLTCNEVEQVAEMFRLAGDEDTAKHIIASHAEYDEEGDDHYVEPVFVVTIAVRAPGHDSPDVARVVGSYIQAVSEPTFELDLISVDTKEAE